MYCFESKSFIFLGIDFDQGGLHKKVIHPTYVVFWWLVQVGVPPSALLWTSRSSADLKVYASDVERTEILGEFQSNL